MRELFDAFAADAPLRDGRGGLPAADTAAVELLAKAMCRLENIEDYLERFGTYNAEGEPRLPVLELEARLRREAAERLASLGMTPESRAKLGLDLARTVSLTEALSEPDAERRAELLAEAGVPAET